MKTYTFIQKNTFGDNTQLNPILAISKEIETLNLFETYDRFGQQVGHYNAGDYSIYNDSCDAEHECIKALLGEFNITSNKNGFNTPGDIDFLEIRGGKIYNNSHIDDEEIENYNEDAVNEFIATWEKENANYTTVNGFDYWDGNDWKTVVTSRDFYEPTHFIVEENAEQMNEEIEASEFVEEAGGKRYYESENFWIVQSDWAGDFESYQLFSKSECDLEDVK